MKPAKRICLLRDGPFPATLTGDARAGIIESQTVLILIRWEGDTDLKNKTDRREDLKRKGLKSTRHRTAILEILEKRTQPATAEQVFFELNRAGISTSLSTVYRELDRLVNKNLVVQVKLNESKKALYEYNRMIHKHYLVCLGCKKMISLDTCPLKAYEKQLEEQTHFRITDHKLNLYGYCPECQAKSLPHKG
jgi:Fur family ferric uptake transcriptional regulator